MKKVKLGSKIFEIPENWSEMNSHLFLLICEKMLNYINGKDVIITENITVSCVKKIFNFKSYKGLSDAEIELTDKNLIAVAQCLNFIFKFNEKELVFENSFSKNILDKFEIKIDKKIYVFEGFWFFDKNNIFKTNLKTIQFIIASELFFSICTHLKNGGNLGDRLYELTYLAAVLYTKSSHEFIDNEKEIEYRREFFAKHLEPHYFLAIFYIFDSFYKTISSVFSVLFEKKNEVEKDKISFGLLPQAIKLNVRNETIDIFFVLLVENIKDAIKTLKYSGKNDLEISSELKISPFIIKKFI